MFVQSIQHRYSDSSGDEDRADGGDETTEEDEDEGDVIQVVPPTI